MNIFSTRALSIAVMLLLLINTGLVIFLLMQRNRSHAHHTASRHQDAFDRMALTLQYTEAQKEQHRALRKDHMDRMLPLYDSIRQVKVLLYSRTSIVEESDSIFINYMAKINAWQTRINQSNYAYYKKVRALLTPEQQPRYDSLLIRMIERGRRDSSQRR
jgi:periplasmic protein CpxP/Spy